MITRETFFPPYLTRDDGAETIWLGLALLGEADPLDLAQPGLDPFYTPSHQMLWQGLLARRRAGQPCGLSTVIPWLG